MVGRTACAAMPAKTDRLCGAKPEKEVKLTNPDKMGHNSGFSWGEMDSINSNSALNKYGAASLL